MAGYYRKFVKIFGLLSKPLTNLLKKGILFTWTSETQDTFDALKHALVAAPVLALPNFAKPFVVETDASDKGVGAVLQQDGHPVAYVSKALSPKSQGLSTYDKECLAILIAVDHWRSYLQHSEFILKTDHRSLTHLDAQRVTSPWQQKALTKLMGLNFRLQYKKGAENRVTDALSRASHQDTLCTAAVSVVQPVWVTKLQDAYISDPQLTELFQTLSLSSPQGHFSLQNGLIRYKNRIWLGSLDQLQHKILSALHTSPMGGHSGAEATYNRVKKFFAWPKLKQSFATFVSQCSVCQQAKPERVPYPGLLSPLPVLEGAWQVVSLDFIEGLPQSQHYNCILVVVDKFSKYAHFIQLSHPFTAMQVAIKYMDSVFKLHGFPSAIISDRDRVFTSTIWQILFKLTGIDLRMSSAYHPQSDGQTERVNQCLETYDVLCMLSPRNGLVGYHLQNSGITPLIILLLTRHRLWCSMVMNHANWDWTLRIAKYLTWMSGYKIDL